MSTEVAEVAETGLLAEERRRRICELLAEQGRVTVEALARRFRISQVTIRADLTALEQAGALARTHGGALWRRDDADLPLAVKRTQHHAEKVRIARLAAGMIRDGETIVLDSGSTTAEIARQVRRMDFRHINVITNALNIALLLADVPAVQLVMPGGLLRPQSNSLSGHMAEAAITGLAADRVFLGADALDPDLGLMTPHLPEARLNARMIGISRQAIVVADSSKLQRRNISLIAPIEKLHVLVTDTGAPASVVEALRKRGLEVLLA